MSLVLTVCCAHCIFWLHFVVALVNSSRCFFSHSHYWIILFSKCQQWHERRKKLMYAYLLKTDGKKWRYICTCCLSFLFFVVLCKMCIKHVCWTKQTVLKSNLKSCGCTNTKPVKKKTSWQKSNLHEMNLDELMYLSLTCKQEAQLNQVPKY